MKIVDYRILRGEVDDLNKRVVELIAEGWQPSGNVYRGHQTPLYVQTMVKYDETSTSLGTDFSNRAIKI